MKAFIQKIYNLIKNFIVNKVHTDGLLHFFCSSWLVLLIYVLGLSIGWAVTITLLIGLHKEAMDFLTNRTVDFRDKLQDNVHDLACDIAGVVLSMIVIVIGIIL